MLYLIATNDYYKVGYTKDLFSLEKRIQAYKTHNPEFELLGLRQGDRKEESTYHDGKKEWIKKDDSFNLIIEDFNLTHKSKELILSTVLNGLEVIKCKEFPDREITTTVYDVSIQGELYHFNIVDDILYIASYKREFWIVPDAKITKTFYTDYNEYREKYWGFIINDEQLICNLRNRLGDTFIVTDSDDLLFEELKNYKM